MLLSIYNSKGGTEGIKYVDDGQIKDSWIIKEKDIAKKPELKKYLGCINANKVSNLPKVFKLQIRASKMENGDRKNFKKTMKFPDSTFTKALEKAEEVYKEMMSRSIVESEKPKTNDVFSKKEVLYKDVFESYKKSMALQYSNRTDKNDYDPKPTTGFHNKHLKSILEMPIFMIDRDDIQSAIDKIKKQGLSERTSRKVYEFVNPVFNHYNSKAAKYGYKLDSPALKEGLEKLENQRGLDINTQEIKDLFKKLTKYPNIKIRTIYMFLMHGRRVGEVLKMKWGDINFSEKLYCIPKLNNKARKDMTYVLSKRLEDALDTYKREYSINSENDDAYVFPQDHNPRKPYSAGTIRNHWKKKPDNVEEQKEGVDYMTIVIHQLRNCIATYFSNVMGGSDRNKAIILGHLLNANMGDTYTEDDYELAGNALDQMLDNIFDEQTVEPINEKLVKLKALFPEKSDEQLLTFIGE